MRNYNLFSISLPKATQFTNKGSRINIWAFSFYSPTSYFDILPYLDRLSYNLLRGDFSVNVLIKCKVNTMKHYK